MSMFLVANRMKNTPAGGIDQALLLHLCRTVNIAGASEDSIDSGAGLSPKHQTRDTRWDGGGFESCAYFGARVWPQSKPPQQKANASDFQRRLSGQPNGTGVAWFPALAWEIAAGPSRDKVSGKIKNRPSIWRVPLINDAVLVSVPKSGPQAVEQNWTQADAWEQATKALIERHTAPLLSALLAEAEDDGSRWVIESDFYASNEFAEIEAAVRSYMASARRVQDEAMVQVLRQEAWHPLYATETPEKAAKAPRRVAGRSNLVGDSPNSVETGNQGGVFPNPAVGVFPNPGVGVFPNPAVGVFPNHASGSASGTSSGETPGVGTAAQTPTSAPSHLSVVQGEQGSARSEELTSSGSHKGGRTKQRPTAVADARPYAVDAKEVLSAATAINEQFVLEATDERVAFLATAFEVGLNVADLRMLMQDAATRYRPHYDSEFTRTTATSEQAWGEFLRVTGRLVQEREAVNATASWTAAGF